MTTKQRLHELIDQLPEPDLEAAERALTDPLMLALLQTPEREEPLSAEEVAGILAAKRDAAAGKVLRFANIDDLLANLHEDAGR